MDFKDLIKIQVGPYKQGQEENKKTIRNKGKSLSEFPENYSILDLETTGLDPKFDEIIEIGIIKVRNNEIIDTYQTLVQPNTTYIDNDDNEIYVDDFIEELTGITNEMLENSPKIEEVIENAINFISEDIIIGHNVNFDINFLYDAIKKYNGADLSNDFLDLMKMARRAIKKINHHRLVDIADFFEYNYEPHRALEDCKATYDLLNLLIKYIEENQLDVSDAAIKSHSKLDLRTLKSETVEIDTENYFYNKNICFTGKLEHFVRKDAAQICVNLGAQCQNNVTKKTDVLVLGNFDYNATVKDNKSTKLKKAEGLKLQGQDIEIMSEDVFLDQINY